MVWTKSAVYLKQLNLAYCEICQVLLSFYHQRGSQPTQKLVYSLYYTHAPFRKLRSRPIRENA